MQSPETAVLYRTSERALVTESISHARTDQRGVLIGSQRKEGASHLLTDGVNRAKYYSNVASKIDIDFDCFCPT